MKIEGMQIELEWGEKRGHPEDVKLVKKIMSKMGEK